MAADSASQATQLNMAEDEQLSLSVIMTVNNRTRDELVSVLASFAFISGNDEYDEMIIVNDRGDRAMIESCLEHIGLSARIVDIDGEPGRLCPSRAWNVGFRAAWTTHYLCISSDVVLGPRSVRRAVELSQLLEDVVIFGKTDHCGLFYSWFLNGVETRTMTAYHCPRPLGFIWVMPAKTIKSLEPYGYDEAFMGGLCYEDNDIVYRMHLAGVDFIFTDDIYGSHLEHDRTFLSHGDGPGLVSVNEQIFRTKWGSIAPIEDMIKLSGNNLYRISTVVSMCSLSRERVASVSERLNNYYKMKLEKIHSGDGVR